MKLYGLLYICLSTSLCAMEKSIELLPADTLKDELKTSITTLNNRRIAEICRHCKQNSITFRYEHNQTPLHLACKTALSQTIIQIIINNLGGVTSLDEQLFTPLHIACFHNNYDTAYTLIINGANPNAQNNNGLTPLHFSSINGDFETARMLISHKSDRAIKDNLGKTAGEFALRHEKKDPDFVELLLKTINSTESKDEKKE